MRLEQRVDMPPGLRRRAAGYARVKRVYLLGLKAPQKRLYLGRDRVAGALLAELRGVGAGSEHARTHRAVILAQHQLVLCTADIDADQHERVLLEKNCVVWG